MKRMSNEVGWTRERKLLALMALPWGIRVDREDDGTFVAYVNEIPDALATADAEPDLGVEVWRSLYASLAVRLDHDDELPLPHGCVLPWVQRPTPAVGIPRFDAKLDLVKEQYMRPAASASFREFSLSA